MEERNPTTQQMGEEKREARMCEAEEAKGKSEEKKQISSKLNQLTPRRSQHSVLYCTRPRQLTGLHYIRGSKGRRRGAKGAQFFLAPVNGCAHTRRKH